MLNVKLPLEIGRANELKNGNHSFVSVKNGNNSSSYTCLGCLGIGTTNKIYILFIIAGWKGMPWLNISFFPNIHKSWMNKVSCFLCHNKIECL